MSPTIGKLSIPDGGSSAGGGAGIAIAGSMGNCGSIPILGSMGNGAGIAIAGSMGNCGSIPILGSMGNGAGIAIAGSMGNGGMNC